MSDPAPGRVTLSFADCWFIFVPPICWSAIVTVQIDAGFEGVHPAWWILDNPGRHALMVGAVLLNNVTCFVALLLLWQLPLRWQRRLNAIVWTMLLSPFAVPMWRVAVHPHRHNADVASAAVDRYLKVCFRVFVCVPVLSVLAWLAMKETIPVTPPNIR